MIASAKTAAPDTRESYVPLLGLAVLGLSMCAFVVAGPWIIATFDFALFIPMMALSGVITIAATHMAKQVPLREGLLIILGLALVMRVFLAWKQPYLSTDVYRYVWDGRVAGAGFNPYKYVPADPILTALRDAAIYPKINRADYAVTAYPPVAQMFFLAVTRIVDGLTTMRLAFVACEFVIIAVMADLLRQIRLPPTLVVAWAWHPLAIWEISNNGHADGLMVALLLAGVWLLLRHRAIAGAIAITFAALVKPYALVVIPAFWRPWDWRMPLAIGATIAVCYLPYIGAGTGVLGFLTTGYLAEEGHLSGDGYWLVAVMRAIAGPVPGLVGVYMVIAMTTLGALALRTALRTEASKMQVLSDIATLLLAGLFFASPNYAWYFLAAVPFVVLGGGIPAWTISLTAMLLYRPIYLPGNDLVWKSLAFLPFLLVTAAQVFAFPKLGNKTREAMK